jgi:hypothetical protein
LLRSLWWWLKCFGVEWDELELFELGDLHVILIFFSLDSSIVFLTFKLLKISFLISVFTFVDLEAEPHILDLKRERERKRLAAAMEVELKEMLNDLDYLKKSLSNPSNLASSFHKVMGLHEFFSLLKLNVFGNIVF